MAAVHLVQALLSIPVLIHESVCCTCPIVLVCLLVFCSKYDGQSSGEEPLRIIAGSQVSVPVA